MTRRSRRLAGRALLDLLPDHHGRLAIDRQPIVLLEAPNGRLGLRAVAPVRRTGVVVQPLQPGLDIAHGPLVVGRARRPARGAAPHRLAEAHLTRIRDRARGSTHGAADQRTAERADARDGADDIAGGRANTGATHGAILSRVTARGQQERHAQNNDSQFQLTMHLRPPESIGAASYTKIRAQAAGYALFVSRRTNSIQLSRGEAQIPPLVSVLRKFTPPKFQSLRQRTTSSSTCSRTRRSMRRCSKALPSVR